MKLQLGVAFGGESVEHEISILSAMQVIQALDKEKYDIFPMYYTKEKVLYCDEQLKDIDVYKDMDKLMQSLKPCTLLHDHQNHYIEELGGFFKRKRKRIDMVLPVMHGTSGEDGVFQGYLEMLGIPHTGSAVLGAAIGQDKVIMKQVLENVKVPIVPWFYATVYDLKDMDMIFSRAEELTYPMIIKPSNLGSSIGIEIVENKEQLHKALIEAFQYDEKVVVEKVIQQLKEVNISVMGDLSIINISCIEEVMKADHILSYHDKYEGGAKTKGMASAKRIIPANLDDETSEEVRMLAKKTFHELHSAGIVRIDFMIDEADGSVYVNEINTIPGSLAFYLWEKTGVSFTELLDRYIQLGLDAYKRKERMIFSYQTNILKTFKKGSSMKGK